MVVALLKLEVMPLMPSSSTSLPRVAPSRYCGHTAAVPAVELAQFKLSLVLHTQCIVGSYAIVFTVAQLHITQITLYDTMTATTCIAGRQGVTK